MFRGTTKHDTYKQLPPLSTQYIYLYASTRQKSALESCIHTNEKPPVPPPGHHHYLVVWPKAVLQLINKLGLLPAVENNQQGQNKTPPKPSPCPSVRAQESRAYSPTADGGPSERAWNPQAPSLGGTRVK